MNFIIINLLAQQFNNDAALWLNLSVQKELNKKLSTEITIQNRINNNISQYGQGSIDAGLTYKISKSIRISGNYMFRENRRLDGSYSTRHQLYTAFTYRKKINSFTIIYRNRLQARFKDIYSSSEGKTPVLYDRNKITLRYEINKRFDIYVSEELYSPFYNFKTIIIDRQRSALGTIYKISKSSEIEAYFMLQQQFYSNKQLRRDFIYGLTYQFDF